MKIQIGYDISYECPDGIPMVVTLRARPSRVQRLLLDDEIHTDPRVALRSYVDGFGNTCNVFNAPGGTLHLSARGIVEDPGEPEPVVFGAQEIPVGQLPTDTLIYLLGSRYCETDLLMQEAWRLFGNVPPGWNRVQAICDFVHGHVQFGYQFARPTKTAFDTYTEGRGVCRDLAHLAITFCRCLNIPARYATSYLGDIGVPPVDAPMDFAGSMEVFLGGSWHNFDPRNNARRIGRILIAHGRDAADAALSTAYGNAPLKSFRVITAQCP